MACLSLAREPLIPTNVPTVVICTFPGVSVAASLTLAIVCLGLSVGDGPFYLVSYLLGPLDPPPECGGVSR